jgi:hypothetical protein
MQRPGSLIKNVLSAALLLPMAARFHMLKVVTWSRLVCEVPFIHVVSVSPPPRVRCTCTLDGAARTRRVALVAPGQGVLCPYSPDRVPCPVSHLQQQRAVEWCICECSSSPQRSPISICLAVHPNLPSQYVRVQYVPSKSESCSRLGVFGRRASAGVAQPDSM